MSQYPHVRKIGLYTSPHLRTVRERIQINNTPLSPDLFTKYFFETWDRITSSTHVSSLLPPPSEQAHPNYFRFLTLAALHAFRSEGVDVAILECGIGGEYDSTNIIPSPAVTAVTSLGLDHVDQLGQTIESIAWHKSGIFKAGAPSAQVFASARQPPGAAQVLRERAVEKGKQLVEVDVHPQVASGEAPLGMEGTFQQLNASVACAVASAFLRQQEHHHQTSSSSKAATPLPRPGTDDPLPPEFHRGLAHVRWQGRCEVRRDRIHPATWYIDGGHTLESVPPIAEWFAAHVSNDHGLHTPRILLFNQQTRDAAVLLRALHAALSHLLPAGVPPWTHAIFSTNAPYAAPTEGAAADASLTNRAADQATVDKLLVQQRLAETMRELDADCSVVVVHYLDEAVQIARDVADGGRQGQGQGQVPVLVTGSLHLVGGLMAVLDGDGGGGGGMTT